MTRVTARPGVDRIDANMAEHMLVFPRLHPSQGL
jgi:hypothetical protein